jgi:hypothetical protein
MHTPFMSIFLSLWCRWRCLFAATGTAEQTQRIHRSLAFLFLFLQYNASSAHVRAITGAESQRTCSFSSFCVRSRTCVPSSDITSQFELY